MYESYYEQLLPYFGSDNIQNHYMDSVTKDTPIILSDSNLNVKILRNDEIINEEDWYKNDNIATNWGEREFADCKNLQVRTSDGWKNIIKIVKLIRIFLEFELNMEL